ncbi:nuclear transport factor 2 family protein [Streptomyces spiralis]
MPCVDPDTVIAEYESKGRILTSGTGYANFYIGIWKFRDGRIAWHRE